MSSTIEMFTIIFIIIPPLLVMISSNYKVVEPCPNNNFVEEIVLLLRIIFSLGTYG